MVFQSFAPVDPRQVTTEQHKKLTEFIETWAKPKGILWPYHSPEEFRDELRRQLATRVNDDAYFAAVETPTGAQLDSQAVQEILDRLESDATFAASVLLPNLSPEAKTLLLAAADDKDGTVMFFKTMDGAELQTNRKSFIKEGDARSEAIWESALDELRNNNFLKDRGHKGEVFQVTRQGYEAADRFRGNQ